MNNQIVVGKYFNVKSIIHRIDPRIKIFFLFLLFAATFINAGFEGYTYLTVFILIIFLLARIPLKMIYNQWKIIIFLFIFLFLLTAALATRHDSNLPYDVYTIGKWHFDKQALVKSIYITWRIFLMIMSTILLTSTTKPLFLTLAIEDILFPLKLCKLPTHEISMMMTIALRFIPTFLEETAIIIKAQKSRGIEFNSGGPKKRMISLISLIIPLFLSSFQKAEDLANAMDSRGYVPGQKRTRGIKFKISIIDIIYLLLICGLFALIIITSHNLKHVDENIHSWNLSFTWWGWLEPKL